MNYTTLNVKGLDHHDTYALRSIFEAYGEVKDVTVDDQDNGRVTFADMQDARAAHMAMKARSLDLPSLRVSPHFGLRPAAP